MKLLLILPSCLILLPLSGLYAAPQTRIQSAENLALEQVQQGPVQHEAARQQDARRRVEKQKLRADDARLRAEKQKLRADATKRRAELEQAREEFQQAVGRLGRLSAALALDRLNDFFPEQGKALSQEDRHKLNHELEHVQRAMSKSGARIGSLSEQLAEQSVGGLNMAHQSLSWLNRPVLGINSSGEKKSSGPGVRIKAVTPGGPADLAGLEAGDVITAINGHSLSNTRNGQAQQKMQNVMAGIQPGDIVTVTYSRKGRSRTAKINTEAFTALLAGPIASAVDDIASAFGVGDNARWRDMRLTKVTPQLKRYFGTGEGVLVVHAPRDNSLKLQDGDVILRIGGRSPATPVQAMRILRSYLPGDSLKLSIKRDKQDRVLNIKVAGGESNRHKADNNIH